jgi:hypothetical protein
MLNPHSPSGVLAKSIAEEIDGDPTLVFRDKEDMIALWINRAGVFLRKKLEARGVKNALSVANSILASNGEDLFLASLGHPSGPIRMLDSDEVREIADLMKVQSRSLVKN